MGFRFRKSIKIAPGVRINLGKKGITSVSVGGNGFTINSGGKQGTRVTAGLPGTGLSYSERLSASPLASAPETEASPDASDTPVEGVPGGALIFWMVVAFLAGAILF